jgi:hypothetical protein
MHEAQTFRSIGRRLAFTLVCIALIVTAIHMLIEPASYSAAGGYAELQHGGGGSAAAAIKHVLRQGVDAVGTTGTAAALALVSMVWLGVLWHPRPNVQPAR